MCHASTAIATIGVTASAAAANAIAGPAFAADAVAGSAVAALLLLPLLVLLLLLQLVLSLLLLLLMSAVDSTGGLRRSWRGRFSQVSRPPAVDGAGRSRCSAPNGWRRPFWRDAAGV